MDIPGTIPPGSFKKSILVAMNDPGLGKVVASWLTRSGHRGIACETFAVMEDALRNSTPDLVIFDYGFDGLPGMETGVRIYNCQEYSSIPLLVLVPQFIDIFVFPVCPPDLEDKGVNWIAKPFERNDIQSWVTRFFETRWEAKGPMADAHELLGDAQDRWDGYRMTGRRFEVQGKLHDAIQAWKAAIRLNPDRMYAYEALGEILWDNRDSSTIQAFHKVERMEPTIADNLRNLEQAFFGTGDNEESRKVWTRSLQYADPPTKRALLAVLENLYAVNP